MGERGAHNGDQRHAAGAGHGVYSSRKPNPMELSARHGGQVTAYHDLDTMLADPNIHAVSICSYPHDHTKHAIKAAKASTYDHRKSRWR